MGSSRNSYRYNNFQPKVDSNPIATSVRRKRQRLPPNLLIENASDRDPPSTQKSAPRRFRSSLAATRKLKSGRLTSGSPLGEERSQSTVRVSRGPHSPMIPASATMAACSGAPNIGIADNKLIYVYGSSRGVCLSLLDSVTQQTSQGGLSCSGPKSMTRSGIGGSPRWLRLFRS